MRPTEDERAARRRRFDDPSTGPLHAPPADARVDFEDICRRLEAVLQGMGLCTFLGLMWDYRFGWVPFQIS